MTDQASTTSPPGLPPTRVERLEGYLRHDPGNVSLMLDLAGEHLAAANPARAHELATQALSIDLHNGLAAGIAILGLLGQARDAQAVQLHRDFTLRNPGLAAQRQVHWAFSSAGKGDAFLDTIDAVLDKEAGLAPSEQVSLVQALHFAGEPARALAQLLRLRSTGAWPREAEPLAALLHFDSQQFQQAMVQAEDCLAEGLDGVDVRYVLASIGLLEGELESATGHLDRALEMDPAEGRCLSLKGQLLMADRRFAEAQPWLEHAALQMPQHIGSRHALGWCLFAQGRYREARQAFEAALAMNRNFAESHGALAVMLAIEGRREDARQAIGRALRLDRNSLSAILAAKLTEHTNGLGDAALHAELAAIAAALPLPGGGSMQSLLKRAGAATRPIRG